MQALRLFIAIEFDDALRAIVQRVQQHIQDDLDTSFVSSKSVRWVAPQNLHLTLKFLGNSKQTQVPALTTALQRIARAHAPFALYARGLGCFPNARHPNTIWIGLDDASNTTALLAQQIEDECATLGIARDERGFTPHLTIGRVKREIANETRANIGAHIKNFSMVTYGTLQVNSLSLISSELKSAGPIYTILATQKFE